MHEIENVKVLILTDEDLNKTSKSKSLFFAPAGNWMFTFKEESRNAIRNAGLILYIDDVGNSIILKNRYGKPQI